MGIFLPRIGRRRLVTSSPRLTNSMSTYQLAQCEFYWQRCFHHRQSKEIISPDTTEGGNQVLWRVIPNLARGVLRFSAKLRELITWLQKIYNNSYPENNQCVLRLLGKANAQDGSTTETDIIGINGYGAGGEGTF